VSTRLAKAVLGGGWVQVVRSAEETGLLDALGAAPATAAALAARLGLDERAVGLVLDVLCAAGTLERHGEAYAVPELVRQCVEELPRLTSFLRTGDVPDSLDRRERRGAYYADGVAILGRELRDAARRLAAELGPARRIVDVGAGSAVWSLSMVEASGGEAIAIDNEAVLHNARATAGALRLEARLTERAGDYFEVWEPGVDRVVLANVLHLETAEDAARLIRHHARALVPEGEMVIVDVFGGDGFEASLFEAVYQLHLGMRTRRGRAHAVEDLRRWCADAGLPAQRVVPLESAGFGALVCRREPRV
jgi:SAM-dependent methyltransferase